MMNARLALLAIPLVGCMGEDTIRGDLSIAPNADGSALLVTFAPASGDEVEPGRVFLEIRSEGVELVFPISGRGSEACAGLPASKSVVLAVPADQSLECASVLATAFQYNPPEAAEGEMMSDSEAPRCGGDLIIVAASWSQSQGCAPDAGPDAGVADSGPEPMDAGVDAGVVDSGTDTSTTG